MVVLVVDIGGELEDVLDDVLAEEGDAREAEVVGTVVLSGVVAGDGAPGGAVVEADAVGLQGVFGGGPVKVEERAPVVANTEADVVVVELGGALTLELSGGDASRLIAGMGVHRVGGIDGVAVGVWREGHGVGYLRGEEYLLGRVDHRAVGATDEHALAGTILGVGN